MTTPVLTLESPLNRAAGVSPERAEQFARLHCRTIGDLLRHQPRRYEDRRRSVRIADLQEGVPATVRGRVVLIGEPRLRRQSLVEMVVDDGSARLHCRWWNLPFMRRYFEQGDEVFVYGKPMSLRPRTMDHPETEVVDASEDSAIHLNRITPIYPLTEGMSQRWLRAFLWRAVQRWAPMVPDPRPELPRPGMPAAAEAIRLLHCPAELDDIERARRRLALDEFLEFQVALQRRRRALNARARGLPCGGTNRLMKRFLHSLPFTLTEAQTRVLRELRRDLSGVHPMRRLLQGDVGSGKTVVAACAILMTLESGYNALLMAPTEILAEQHYRTFREWFEPLDLGVALRTGSRRDALDARHPGASPSLAIGTHALIDNRFVWPNLGLVIIDEQHKFGVAQREQLVRKANAPHLLVMTATPIPRTLGLTLYGDLDVSVITALPRGRGRIKTFVRMPDALDKVLKFVRDQLNQGRQAYLVYPRVEESKHPIKAVTREFAAMAARFAPHRAGLLHGRLRGEEKERVAAGFRDGTIRVLVATSVVEVGVDVPNATVMVIENAEQFGLAQLHQLRGRIGRGPHPSYCILMAARNSPEAKARLAMLEKTHDGFRVAEADLAARGPGELLGREQSGLPPFRFGELAKDGELLEKARDMAVAWCDAHPVRGAGDDSRRHS